MERIAESVDAGFVARRGSVQRVIGGVTGVVRADGGVRDDQGLEGGTSESARSERHGCPGRVEVDVNLAVLAELTEVEGAELPAQLGTWLVGVGDRLLDRFRPEDPTACGTRLRHGACLPSRLITPGPHPCAPMTAEPYA